MGRFRHCALKRHSSRRTARTGSTRCRCTRNRRGGGAARGSGLIGSSRRVRRGGLHMRGQRRNDDGMYSPIAGLAAGSVATATVAGVRSVCCCWAAGMSILVLVAGDVRPPHGPLSALLCSVLFCSERGRERQVHSTTVRTGASSSPAPMPRHTTADLSRSHAITSAAPLLKHGGRAQSPLARNGKEGTCRGSTLSASIGCMKRCRRRRQRRERLGRLNRAWLGLIVS